MDSFFTRLNGIDLESLSGAEAKKLLAEIVESKEAQLHDQITDAYHSSALGMALADAAGNFIDCNKAFASILGYNRENLKNSHFSSLTSPEDISKEQELLSEIVSGKRDSYILEKRCVRSDNSTIWTKLHLTALRGADNAPLQFFGILEDVDQHKSTQMVFSDKEERYRSLVACLHEGVVMQDSSGKIIACNGSAEQILGLTRSQMEGRTSLDPRWRAIREDGSPYPGEGHPAMITLRTGEPVRKAIMGVNKPDDGFRWISINSEPFFSDNNPSPSAVVSSFIDITEECNQREAQRANAFRLQSLNDLSSLYRKSRQEILEFALDKILLLTSSKFGYLYLYSEEAEQFTLHAWSKEVMDECRIMAPQTVYDLHKTGVWGEVVRQRRPFMINEFQVEHPLKKGYPEGHVPLQRWLSIPVEREGKIVAVVGVANKIEPYSSNDQVQLGLLMQGVWEQIERLNWEADIQEAKVRSEDASRAKSEFLANMSHEVRTPLNGIMGMLELMKLTDPNDEQQEYVNTAIESSHGLMTIINDILDFSRIEAGKLIVSPEPVEIASLIQGVRGMLAESIRAKQLNLSISIDENIPSSVVVDKGRLRHILLNLLGNAAKFTSYKGDIFLTVSMQEGEDHELFLHFKIADTGIGIAPGYLERVFEPFSQEDASNRRAYEGSGLGLSIVRRLVQLLGGEVTLISVQGEGTVVDFSVMIERTSQDAMERERDNELEQPDVKRLLVVEDNPINQLMLVRSLEKLGHRVITASSGEEALKVFTVEAFDLVLMDIQMPGMDGLETTGIMRNRERFAEKSDIPIVAVTAHAMDGDRERFLAAGLDAYLAKPVSIKDLREMIQTVERGSDTTV